MSSATVRIATADDAAAVRDIYAPFVESTPISFELEAPTVAEMADRIETTVREYPWLVCEVDGEVVGYAAAGPLRSTPPYAWTVELSVYVADGARRSGVGRGLYASLFELLERQGYCDAYAVVTVPNPPSDRLHERLGFEPVGRFPNLGYKDGEWHDVRWWHRPIGERPADPEPPTPLPEVRDDPGWESALSRGEEAVEL